MKYKIEIFKLPMIQDNMRFENSSTIANELKKFENVDRELLITYYLTSNLSLIESKVISIGTINSANVNPIEIFKPAILVSSTHIILGHNHPGGSHAPSPMDNDFTTQIVKGGCILGIAVLDHIIFSRTGYYSYADDGKITEYQIKGLFL